MRPLFLSLLCGVIVAALPMSARADEQALAQAGVPALTRAWSGEDYAFMADLVAAGSLPLPLIPDPEGRQILARLTALENLAACRDPKLPLDVRMGNFGKLLGGVSKILDLYQAEANKGKKVGAEAAQLSAFALRTVGVGVGLINELMPTVKQDEKYNVRMDGIKKFQAGLISMFVNTETSLSQPQFFSVKDLSALLEAMAETLPTVIRAIPAEYRQELRKKLEADRDAFIGDRDLENIQKMLDELGK